MATTWLPHLLGNSLALLLPELYRLAERVFPSGQGPVAGQRSSSAALRETAAALVRDNPDYLDYVAPATLAYLVSHPDFNIYRGEWGKLELFGFGLDSIPHGATAYALSNLVYDTVERLEMQAQPGMAIWPPVRWMAGRKHLVAGVTIAGLTLIYETAEYLVYKSELRKKNNDASQINMVWGVKDTIFDVLSNGIGWAAAAWRHRSCQRDG
jgi:hypothetical protein